MVQVSFHSFIDMLFVHVILETPIDIHTQKVSPHNFIIITSHFFNSSNSKIKGYL